MDALNIISERRDELELIMTNVHRTHANRFGIIEHIEKEFKLKIILMSPDDIKDVSRGSGNGVTVYFMKSLSLNEINDLWSNALAREKRKRESSSEMNEDSQKHKRTRETSEKNGDAKDESNVEKKPRVVWTKEMHQKFVEAVAQLGHDKAFPKKIVELMNVPGLTRENVASHLQKYRLCMKRAQEGFPSSLYGLNLVNDFSAPFGFNNSHSNFQRSNWNPFQLGSRSHCRFDFYGSRVKLPQSTLANDFRIYGDDTKNVLLSVDNKVPSKNTSFIGFRLTGDGKSLEFGQNGHLSANEKVVQYPFSFDSQIQPFFLELGNDHSSPCPNSSFSGNFTQNEPVSFTPQDFDHLASFTSQLQDFRLQSGNDYSSPCPSFPVGFTPQKPSSLTSVLGVDHNKMVNDYSTLCPSFPVSLSFTGPVLGTEKNKPESFAPQQQDSLPLGNDYSTPCSSLPVCFTPPQQDSLLQMGNDYSNPCPSFPVSFTPQQQDCLPRTGNDYSTPCPSFPVSFTPQQQDCLPQTGNDYSTPCTSFPVSFPQQQDTLPQNGNDYSTPCPSFPVSFTPQQHDSLLQMGNDYSTPGMSFPISFTPQQQETLPQLGNDHSSPHPLENADSEILSDFTSLPLPSLGFCDRDDGAVDVIEKTARCFFDEDFDDLLFGRQDLTF